MPNVTMTLDEELLKRARKIAVDRDTTLTGLIREYLEDLVRRDQLSRNIAAEELQELFDRSVAVVGPQTWSRDELHER